MLSGAIMRMRAPGSDERLRNGSYKTCDTPSDGGAQLLNRKGGMGVKGLAGGAQDCPCSCDSFRDENNQDRRLWLGIRY